MAVRIVTDSPSDVPSEVARELSIAIIPINLIFGTQVYRDGVDLTTEQFYKKLTTEKTHPTTAVPSPATYAEVYDRLAEETDEICVITVSRKLSASNEVALQARKFMKKPCRVEVIDSLAGAMQEGLIAIAAAKAAKAGANLDEVIKLTQRNIPRAELRMAFDTLEYLKRGGRIGRAQYLLGSMLRVHPILGIKDGEADSYARPRSRAKALEYLYEFALSYSHIEEMSVEDATTPDEARMLVERLSSKFPAERIYRTKVSPVVGAHIGPRALAVAVLGDK